MQIPLIESLLLGNEDDSIYPSTYDKCVLDVYIIKERIHHMKRALTALTRFTSVTENYNNQPGNAY